MHEKVIRKGLKILGTLSSGSGDPLLTLDSTSKEVGSVPAVDSSVFISTTLESGKLIVGNSSDVATAVEITGAITVDNTGLSTIIADYITNNHINSVAAINYSKLNLASSIINSDISTSAGISRSKLASGNSYRILVNNNLGLVSENDILTADRLTAVDSNGLLTSSSLTTTVASYIDINASLQGLLNNKLEFSDLITPNEGDLLYYTSGEWTNITAGAEGEVLTITSGLPTWETGVSNGIPSGGTAGQYLNKIDSTNYNTQWSTLTLSKITDITALAADVNLLGGLAAAGLTNTELGYVNGLTSPAQTQLESKLNKALPYNSLFVGNGANEAIALSAGSNDQVLTIVSGVPTWQTPTPPGDVTGPASSTDNAIARWNSTPGNAIQDSGVIIDDSNNITGIVSLTGQSITLSGAATSVTLSTAPANDDALTQVLVRDGATGIVKYRTAASIAGGVSDGDKGDITVSGSGATWTIDNDTITYAKIQNISATDRILGRDTAGAGDTEELTVSGGIEFTGSGGIQTSAFTGDVTKSAGGTALTIANQAVTYGKIQNASAGLTILGRGVNSAGSYGEITAASDGDILRRSGTTVDFGTIGNTSIDDLDASKITSTGALTKVDDTNITLTLGGSPATSLLAATSLTLGWTGTLAAGRLNSNVVQAITNDTNVTGSIASQNLTLAWSGTLAYSRFVDGVGLSVVGRSANSAGVQADITAGTDAHVLRRSGTTLGFGTIGNASIADLAWSKLTSLPTTIAGYGITDGYKNGGNAFGATSTLGLTDDFPLTIQTGNNIITFNTNSAEKGRIDAEGISTWRRRTTGTSAALVTSNLVHQTSNNMVDGFGTLLSFVIRDSAGVDNPIVYIGGERVNSVDNSGVFIVHTANAGTITERFRVNHTGQAANVYTTTSTTGKQLTTGTTALSTGSTSNGFGPSMVFKLQDSSSSTANTLASIGAVRAGADNTGDFYVGTVSAGVETEWLRLTSAGNLALFGATTFDTGVGVLALKNATTAPAAGDADECLIYTKDVTSSSELFVMDESGFETQIS